MDALTNEIINSLSIEMTHLVAAADTEHDLPFSVFLIVFPAIREVLALRVGHTIWALANFRIASDWEIVKLLKWN